MPPTARSCPSCCTGKIPGYGVTRPTAGQRAVIQEDAPKARDFPNRRYHHRGVVDEAKNRTKSRVRARVEHMIGVIKQVFGFAKVRYCGLNKNLHRMLVTCALAILFMARRHLLRWQPA